MYGILLDGLETIWRRPCQVETNKTIVGLHVDECLANLLTCCIYVYMYILPLLLQREEEVRRPHAAAWGYLSLLFVEEEKEEDLCTFLN